MPFMNASTVRRGRRLFFAGMLLACPSVSSAQTASTAEVQAVVERFLAAAGRQDFDSLPGMFAPGASWKIVNGSYTTKPIPQ